MNATVSGTGSYLGDKEYSNFDLWNSDLRIGGFNIGDLVRESFDIGYWRKKLEEAGNGTNLSDAEVFDKAVIQMSGIKKRCFSTTRGAEELGAEAAKNALDMAGVSPSDVDYFIVGTFTGDRSMPQPAITIKRAIADSLGIPEGKTPALTYHELVHNEACSGFLYGMEVAHGLLQTGNYETILVTTADRLSSVTNFRDYKTAFLFGDGAGAVVLKADENGGVICPPYTGAEYSNSILQLCGGLIQMEGGEDVFVNAVRKMVDSSHIALLYHAFARGMGILLDGSPVANYKQIKDNFDDLKKAYPLDMFIKDVDWTIPHQANFRILKKTASGLGIDEDELIVTINRYANTSGSSIPIAYDEYTRGGKIKDGDVVLMQSYGGASTFGGLVFTHQIPQFKPKQ